MDRRIANTLTSLVVVLTSGAVLTGCGVAKVAVPVPTPNPAIAAACSEIVKAMPATVDGQERRSVADSSQLTAAWGDPAITLRCGVDSPSNLKPESSIMTINGVDWFPEQLTAGYRFTTVNSAIFIEVNVPDKYNPEANALTDITNVLASK